VSNNDLAIFAQVNISFENIDTGGDSCCKGTQSVFCVLERKPSVGKNSGFRPVEIHAGVTSLVDGIARQYKPI
jgi:hypothetical protein